MLLTIGSVFSRDAVAELRREIDAGPWVDGRATAGSLSAGVKDNLQLAEDSEPAVRLGNRILAVLGRNSAFISAALPHRIFPPRFNRYAGGGHYGVHVDGAVLYHAASNQTVRSDLSATLFLTEPEDYDGGELCVETAFGVQEVKLGAGDLVLYPSSSLHEVRPVTRGARICAFFWIQSLVRDPGQRAMLYDLDRSVQALTARLGSTDPELLTLNGIYHNLLRQWAET
jgi:PKHD-type hydroxylase